MCLGVFVRHGSKRGMMNTVYDGTPRVESKGYCREHTKNGGYKWKLRAKHVYSHHFVGRGIVQKIFVKGVYFAPFSQGVVAKHD